MTTPVTLVTQDATLDEFSVSDYRDMVIELLGTYSLRQLDDMTGNICSPALWAKVQHGKAVPNRKQRNALRKLYNRAPLPPTVADAVSVASPDAAVWAVGDGVPEHVIMVAGVEPVTLHVNGAVTVAQKSPVTPVTNGKAERKPRIRYSRPCATKTQQERRIAVGATWAEVIEAGLKAWEVIA
jgi:hypothetical protein